MRAAATEEKPVIEPESGTTVIARPAAAGERTGIVLRVHSGICTVQPEPPEPTGRPLRYICELRGNLKKRFTYSTSHNKPRRVVSAGRRLVDVAAVGDRVRFTVSEDGAGVIEEILPRRSRFARASFRGREQTLVSNLDQLVVVFACAEPRPDLWLLDRWLVATEASELTPLIVANKGDLVSGEDFHELFDEFAALGYSVLETSAVRGNGIGLLRDALNGRVSAFTGPSGVGKSSLLNALQPGLHLETAEVGGVTHKGRHTTTVRQLIPLETGGWVADTPGLRQLDLLPMDREALAACFIEFRPVLESPCRFRDCRHENEPGCALKSAVEAGGISPRRYESFLILCRELGC
jgi:ribosome biogenesis GTPase